MKILNKNNGTSFELKSVRELTFNEVQQISGGTGEGDFPHGKSCGCMTCRINNDKKLSGLASN
jgi:hypothetical protein